MKAQIARLKFIHQDTPNDIAAQLTTKSLGRQPGRWVGRVIGVALLMLAAWLLVALTIRIFA